ncbi:galanin receptor 2b-like [Patiria miniata]|uniref:G-protein coupled receptors family 1 profile domain-containing protein n=1 Tax=Patiria miniata TaxID=46514 RepID=A0A914ARJ4_PATMI|nr:galanin receptor 2b-like [Patiria miniata]
MADVAIRVIQTVSATLGVLGNVLVCVVIGRVRTMHTLTNAFILNQAAIDLMGSVFTLIEANAGRPNPVPPGLAGELYCRVWYSKFFIWAFFAASTYSLVALTLERYLAIVFPYRYQVVFTKRKAVLVIVFVWMLGLVNSVYNLIYVAPDGKGLCVSVKVAGSQIIGAMLFLTEYAIPVAVMLYAYIHITMVLKRSANRVGPVTGEGAGNHGGQEHQGRAGSLLRARKNVFKTLLIVFCSFVVCWTPNKIIFFMFNFGWPLDFSSSLYVFSVALVAANVFVNPVIYALKYRQFRRGIKVLLGRAVHADEIFTTSAGQVPIQSNA